MASRNLLGIAAGLMILGMLGNAREAHAQYKNMSWGIHADFGFWTPGANANFYAEQDTINNGGVLTNGASSPNGLPYGNMMGMLQLELNFALSNDFHWWFKTGINLGVVQVASAPIPPDQITTTTSRYAGGIGLLIEAVAGPRVYLLTDNVRPFFELGVRIPIPGVLVLSNSNDGIPQVAKTFPGIYGSFGVEFFIARDVSFAVSGAYTRYIVFNYPGFNSIDGKLGFLFYM